MSRRPLAAACALALALAATPAAARAAETVRSGDHVLVHEDRAGAPGKSFWVEDRQPRQRIRAAQAGITPTAVVMIQFPDAPESQATNPHDPATVRRQVFGDATADQFSVRQYFLEQTYGKVDLSGVVNPAGDVYGPYSIPNPGGDMGCAFGQWSHTASQMAAADGFDLNAYGVVIYLYSTNRCLHAGVGGGGSRVWINGLNRYTIAHEIGHTFGNGHASTWRCRDGGGVVVTLSGACDTEEYGDPFDPMGGGGTLASVNSYQAVPHQMEPGRKVKIGALTAADTPVVNTPGRYHLEPLERNAGTRMLRLPTGRGDELKFFDLSFRQPIGVFDSTWLDPDTGNPRAFDGVLVAFGVESFGGSLLLDMTPETPGGEQHPFTHLTLSGFEDAPLRAGRSFTDPFTGLTLTVDSVSDAGADVTVAYGQGQVDVATPTVPGAPNATVKDGLVSLSWAPSTDGFGVQRYLVERDATALALRRAATSLPDVTSPATTDRPGLGTFSYSVRAVDAAGNVSPPSTTNVTLPLTLAGLRIGSSFRVGRSTKIAFKLNHAASVTFAFARQLPGRRKGKSCVAPAKSPRGKRCARSVAVRKRLGVAGKLGTNSVKFNGRIGKTRLAAGSYRVTATARDQGGTTSKPVTAAFKLLPRAKK